MDAWNTAFPLPALNDFDDPAGFFSMAEDPNQLDSELQERYVGMSAVDAASAVVGDGIAEVRVFRLPFRSAYRQDHIPNRLNLAVLEGRIIRVAFFNPSPNSWRSEPSPSEERVGFSRPRFADNRERP